MLASVAGQLDFSTNGFDQDFNDATSLLLDAESVLASFDGDLTDAGIAVPLFANTAAADMAASLQPAADATDTALLSYDATLASSRTSCTPGDPGCGTITQPTPTNAMLGTPNPTNPTPDFKQPCMHTDYFGLWQQGTGIKGQPILPERLPPDYQPKNCTAAQMTGPSINNPTIALVQNTLSQTPAEQVVVELNMDTATTGHFTATVAMQFDNKPDWYYECVSFDVG